MDIKELFYKAMKIGYQRGWHRLVAKYAVSSQTARWQPLLYHAINAALIAWEVAPIFKAEEHRSALFVGMFLHDYTKHRESFQSLSSRGGEMPSKTPNKEERLEMEEIIRLLGLSGEDARLAFKLALLNETPNSPDDIINQLGSGPLPQNLLDAAVFVDILISLKGFWELPGRLGEILRRYGYSIAYHRVSQVRGIVTQLIHKAIVGLMVSKGYRPVLYLADGVIYIGRNEASVSREELRKALVEAIRGFLESLPPQRLGQAAFGNIVQTVIRAPEFLKASSKAVEGLWDHVSGQNFVRKPNVSAGIKRALAKHGITGVEADDIGAKIVSTKNLFIVYKEVLKIVGEDGADERLAEALGIDSEEIKGLRVIGNTTRADKLVNILLPFLRKTRLITLTSSQVTDKLLEAMRNATKNLSRGSTVFEKEVSLLLKEILLWGEKLTTDIIVEIPEPAYERGKGAISPVCFLCGATITGLAGTVAVASLVGKGAESFHNLRAAGETTGGEKKARICPICRLEASLRSLLDFNPNRDDIYYVLPSITMSPTYASQYWTMLVLALQTGERFALNQPSFWRKYLEGINPVEVARDPLALHEAMSGSKESMVRNLAEKLKETYELEDLIDFGISANSYEEAARVILQGKISPDVAEELASFTWGSDYTTAMYSGNYMMVIAREPGYRDESEASKMLRRLNRALMLHRLFHAFVLVPDEKMVPFPEPRPLGAVKVPLKADLASMLRRRGAILRNGWVDFTNESKLQAEELSLALTAAELVDNEMRKAGTGYGRSGLLEVLSRPPGMMLARYVSAGKNRKGLRDFLKYLNELEKRWWK